MLWILIRKDLIRRWRSPASTLVMLLFPFLMAGLVGAVSGGGGQGISAIKVFVLDREDGLLGYFLSGANPSRDRSPRIEIEMVGEDGFARMEQGEASAMLIIPAGLTDDLLDGRDSALQLIRNPAESIKPEIIEQGTEVIATYLDVAVKTLGAGLAAWRDLLQAETMPPVALVTAVAGEIYSEMTRAETILFPPLVRVVREKEKDADGGGPSASVFGYVLVMVSVMSVLFVAIRAVTDLYEDQRTGMLRRQLATPASVAFLVAAKTVFAVAFGVVVMAILLLAGTAFGWFAGRLPVLWILLHAVCFALAAAGLMTVVVALVRTEKQAGIMSWLVVMLMSVLGGSMFPAESLPAAVRPLSLFTLNYWAVEGFLDLMVRQAAVAVVVPRTVLLAVVGVILVGLGQLLMRRRLREVLR